MFRFDFDKADTADSENAASSVVWEESEKVSMQDVSIAENQEFSTFNSRFGLSIKTISSSQAVEEAISSGCESIREAELEHSDLIPGKYEGGLKIWECTRDLDALMSTLDLKWDGLRVLDLGCGAGVLGLAALLKGSHVVFQDYNKEVLQLVTGRNILLNIPKATEEVVKLYSGDWASFVDLYTAHNHAKFDVILSSETVYNVENYSKLHEIIHKLLTDDGVCYMAGKSVYFGVGGSMLAFSSFIKKRGALNVEPCWSHSQGVTREIFKITHKSKEKENGTGLTT